MTCSMAEIRRRAGAKRGTLPLLDILSAGAFTAVDGARHSPEATVASEPGRRSPSVGHSPRVGSEAWSLRSRSARMEGMVRRPQIIAFHEQTGEPDDHRSHLAKLIEP